LCRVASDGIALGRWSLRFARAIFAVPTVVVHSTADVSIVLLFAIAGRARDLIVVGAGSVSAAFGNVAISIGVALVLVGFVVLFLA